METVIWVIDGEKEIDQVIPLLRKERNRIVLFGLLPPKESPEGKREHDLWHSLFFLRERLSKEGFFVSVATERGSPFSLLATVKTLEAKMVFLPKEKFLLLGPLENDDFLNQIPCPILLY